jgi:hypothetical protein
MGRLAFARLIEIRSEAPVVFSALKKRDNRRHQPLAQKSGLRCVSHEKINWGRAPHHRLSGTIYQRLHADFGSKLGLE